MTLGLVDQTDRQAFLPLDANEVTEVDLARRLIGYRKLVDKIAARLEESGVVKLESGDPYWGPYRAGWMRYRTMRVRDGFDMRLGIQVKAWRDLGITPLWWMLRGAVGNWQRIKAGMDEVRSYRGRLHIPIPLPSDAEEARMIDAAVDRMRDAADRLVTASRGVTSRGPSRPPARVTTSARTCRPMRGTSDDSTPPRRVQALRRSQIGALRAGCRATPA